MSTCETCKHWEKGTAQWGECHLFSDIPPERHRPGWKRNRMHATALTVHGDGRASFMTSPVFGCAQHTPSETTARG